MDAQRISHAAGREGSRLSDREGYPGRSRGMSRAELGFGISHETKYILKGRLSRIEVRTSMPSTSGAKLPPGPNCPLPDREKELPPPSIGVGAIGGSGVGVGGVLLEAF